MNPIQIYMINHNYNLFDLYLCVVAISAILRYPIALINLKICSHSDGGGWDAGTSYSFVPTLKRKESIGYEDDGFFAMRMRSRVFTWILFPMIPFYWVLQFLLINTYLYCVLSYFLNYGEISRLVDINRYEQKGN
jgi:hypothetical protein